jgi:hypothetical protein
MLPNTGQNVQAAITEIIAWLDLQAQLRAERLMQNALAKLEISDEDAVASNQAWDEYDEFTVELGPAHTREMSIFDTEELCMNTSCDYLENDDSDPDYGDPNSWGLWADRDTYELGPNLPPDKDTIPTSPLWQAWLTKVPLID